MIKIDGVELRTEAQWGQKYRAVLKRQIGKGVKRQWIKPGGRSASAVFYREDQTRPYNQKEIRRAQRKRQELERTRKERLSCRCCGEYFGRDARFQLKDGLCEFCCKPHTAWQWLDQKHCAPKRGEKPTGRHPRYWNPETDGWEDSPKEWFYYASTQVSRVSDKRFERLKSIYIKQYGGWDTIDLEHTTYDGHTWW